MGIIKTAMMTGGGIYAVNKLAKGMDNRGGNRGSGSPYPPQNPQQAQGYWGPPPAGQNRYSQDAYYQDNNNNRQQHYRAQLNDPRDGPSSYQYSQDVYRSDMKMPDQQQRFVDVSSPPAYGGAGDYQPQYQGQVYEPREQRTIDGRFDSSSLASMAGMAMNAVGGEGKSGKSGKGMDVVGQFLKRN